MHVDQESAQLLERGERHRLIVQVGFGAAVGMAFSAD
jgi:hypothetical protein